MKIISPRLQIWVTAIVVFIMAIGLTLWALHQTSESHQEELQNGVILAAPATVQPFQLHGTDGKLFDNESLKNHWSLLFFGFTHCTSICPTTLAKLNHAYQELAQSSTELPQVIFISVDPKRDDAATIRRYLESFNRTFIGATGSEPAVEKLAQQLGIAYLQAIKSNEKDYQIEHSGAILIINPKAELVAILTSSISGKTIAQDFQKTKKATAQ